MINFMKNEKNNIDFEIKKKSYKTPYIKEYGNFSNYTKGEGTQGNESDGQTYYGNPLYS